MSLIPNSWKLENVILVLFVSQPNSLTYNTLKAFISGLLEHLAAVPKKRTDWILS